MFIFIVFCFQTLRFDSDSVIKDAPTAVSSPVSKPSKGPKGRDVSNLPFLFSEYTWCVRVCMCVCKCAGVPLYVVNELRNPGRTLIDKPEEQNALKLFKHAVLTSGKLQVGRVGQKKKARMARTRSDFLTRTPILSVGGDSDEENDSSSPLSPRHYTLPSSQSSMEAGLGDSCFSDSDMVTGAIQAKHGPLFLKRGFSVTSNPLPKRKRERAHIHISPPTDPEISRF